MSDIETHVNILLFALLACSTWVPDFSVYAPTPPTKTKVRPGCRLAMTPAERRPAHPIGNEPKQVLAEHQDHGRNCGQNRCHGHDRFRAKVRENQ